MARILEERILESSTSTGAGDFALAGAVVGFRRFNAVCAIGDTFSYLIEAIDATGAPTGAYEYGTGTYSAANVLTRTTVLGSSNAGAAVNFVAGSKNVAIVLSKTELDARYVGKGGGVMTGPLTLFNGSTAPNQLAGDNSTKVANTAYADAAAAAAAGAVLLRSYLAGLTMSTAGSSTTMTVAAGAATNSTNAALMSLAAPIAKTTAAWAVGNAVGGLDTGAIAANTWYYFFLIRRPDTGIVDVLFSLSPTAPTMPANYTQFRYIGAGLTSGLSQWMKFVQIGDEFWWDSPPADVNSGATGTAAVLATLSVPRGRKVKALVNLTPGSVVYVTDPAASDLAPSTTAAPGSSTPGNGLTATTGVWTNTAAQIRYRANINSSLLVVTLGWTDLRGQHD